jgi:hypothetical protein
MNGNVKLLFLLSTLLIISSVKADYNITCERDCIAFQNVTCINYSDFYGNQDSVIWNNPTWNEEWNTNWTHRLDFTYLPAIRGNTVSCSLNLDNYHTISAGSCITGTTPFTAEVLNSSNTYFTGLECLPAGSGGITNEICFTNASTKDFQYVIYNSTNGSCSGEWVDWLWGNLTTGCVTEYDLTPYAAYDIYYYFEHWGNVGTSSDCYDYYDQFCGLFTTGTGSNPIWDLNCSLPCDSNDQFAWAFTLDNSAGKTVNRTGYQYFNQTMIRTDCEEGYHYCSLYDEPYNNSLAYSCECPPEEEETYFSCVGDSCTKTCSGTKPIQISNQTLGNVFATGESGDVLKFFTDQITGFLTGVQTPTTYLFGVLMIMALFMATVFAVIYIIRG